MQGRLTPDLDELLTRTKAGSASGAEPVPRSFSEVADALSRCRASLERGDAFPPTLVDAILASLRDQLRGL